MSVDSCGVASHTILEAAATGGITVTEDSDTLADYAGAYVYCAEQTSGTVLWDGNAPDGAVTFTANQGDDIVCDWNNITGVSAGDETGGGPSTGAGAGEQGSERAWLGAAAIGGAAACLAAKKLRGVSDRP